MILTMEPPPSADSATCSSSEETTNSSLRVLTDLDCNSELSTGTAMEGVFDTAFTKKKVIV